MRFLRLNTYWKQKFSTFYFQNSLFTIPLKMGGHSKVFPIKTVGIESFWELWISGNLSASSFLTPFFTVKSQTCAAFRSLDSAFSLFITYRQDWLDQPLLCDSYYQLKQFSSVDPISSLYCSTSGRYELNHRREEPLGCKMETGWLESCPETNLLLTIIRGSDS